MLSMLVKKEMRKLIKSPKKYYIRAIQEIKYLLNMNKWKEQNVSKQSAIIIEEWDARYNKMIREARKKDYSIASKDNMLKYKKSNRLYILGSGLSINDIDDYQWETIAKHDSFAFNWFLAHPFVPTFYHMEFLPQDTEIFKECYLTKGEEFKKIPIILNMRHLFQRFKPKSFDYIENLYVSAPRVFNQATEKNLKEIFKYYYFNRDYVNDNFLIHYRASLMIAISFGILMDYEEIILAGIDLNNNDYFFFDQFKYDDKIAIKVREHKKEAVQKHLQKSSSPLHRTVDPSKSKKLPLDLLILLVNEYILRPKGISLFLMSHKSRLYPHISLYLH